MCDKTDFQNDSLRIPRSSIYATLNTILINLYRIKSLFCLSESKLNRCEACGELSILTSGPYFDSCSTGSHPLVRCCISIVWAGHLYCTSSCYRSQLNQKVSNTEGFMLFIAVKAFSTKAVGICRIWIDGCRELTAIIAVFDVHFGGSAGDRSTVRESST